MDQKEGTIMYRMWTEQNGWENETWHFLIPNVTPEMEKQLKIICAKLEEDYKAHFATSPVHTKHWGGACCGCTKFKLEDKVYTTKQTLRLHAKNSPTSTGYMDEYIICDELDLAKLTEVASLSSSEDMFQRVYKGQITELMVDRSSTNEE